MSGAGDAVALSHADSEAEVAACFPVMRLLRPHLASAEELVARVARQRAEGYRLLAAWRGASAIGLAGWRLQENLIHGRFLYVDDLVTAEGSRGLGLGARLLDACTSEGRKLGCRRLVLDTALDNVLAHRFYYRQRMLARALRFSRDIDPG
jgi:ribosomal protein S18 acetylase RimI-like enzyme